MSPSAAVWKRDTSRGAKSLAMVVAAVACNLASAHVFGKGQQCTTCSGPAVSWDTLPVAFHSAEAATGPDGVYSDAELATIAKFPMATIEKWQGFQATTFDEQKPVFLWEEDAMVNSARAIKAKSPATSVIVWLDSMRIYTGWFWPASQYKGVNHTLNPDAKANCATGHFQPAQFLERNHYTALNASGLPAIEPWSGCHMFDFTAPEAQQFWLDMCLNLTATGVIDGCGADASWQLACILNDPTDPASGCESTNFGMNASVANTWDRGRHASLRATTAALGDGILFGKVPEELWDPAQFGESTRYVNGALHEGCAANNETINSLRNITAASKASGERLFYECHVDCPSTHGSPVEACRDNVAAFLVGAGDDHFFVTGGWTSTAADNGSFATHWIPGLFDQPLGTPLGDGIYDAATGSWTRSFAHGAHVQFNTTSNTGTIAWGTAPGEGSRPAV